MKRFRSLKKELYLWLIFPGLYLTAYLLFAVIFHSIDKKYQALIPETEIVLDWKALLPEPIPDHENASVYLEKVANAIYEKDNSTESEDESDEPLGFDFEYEIEWYAETAIDHITNASPEVVQKTKSMIEPYHDELNWLYAFLKIDRARNDGIDDLGDDEDSFTSMDSSSLSMFKGMIVCDILLSAYEGDYESAYHKAGLLIRLARIGFIESPFFPDRVSSMQAVKQACELLNQLERAQLPTPEQRRAILEEIDRLELRRWFAESVRMACALGMNRLETTLREPNTFAIGNSIFNLERIFLDPFVRIYLKTNQTYLRYFYATHLHETKATARSDPPYGFHLERLPGWCYLYYILPDMEDDFQTRDECLVRLDQVRLSFVLLDYRERHGSYPVELEAIDEPYPWPWPADPFGTGPYRYKLQTDLMEDGYVLYSAGSDLSDDGGIPENPDYYYYGDEPFKGDLIWTIP